MPDHRFMYPKVVPVAALKPAVAGPTVHNFADDNLRISLQGSTVAQPAPKTATSF
jgi:hypothetical protein